VGISPPKRRYRSWPYWFRLAVGGIRRGALKLGQSAESEQAAQRGPPVAAVDLASVLTFGIQLLGGEDHGALTDAPVVREHLATARRHVADLDVGIAVAD
jgi:hypothetical protein